MNIYKLEPIFGEEKEMYWGYDCYDSFIIRAESEEEARSIAQNNGGDEIYNCVYNEISIWTNENITSCEIVNDDGKSGIICSSFNAG